MAFIQFTCRNAFFSGEWFTTVHGTGWYRLCARVCVCVTVCVCVCVCVCVPASLASGAPSGGLLLLSLLPLGGGGGGTRLWVMALQDRTDVSACVCGCVT